MPEYRFVDHNTNKEWLEWMGISAADEYLAANPHIERLVHGCPRIVSKVGMFGHKKKPDEDFNSLLKNIKKKNPGSTIETY